MTRKSHFRNLRIQLVDNLAIRNLTHLEILVDSQPALVAGSVHAFGHKRATRSIRLTQVAIYPTPPLCAVAALLVDRTSVTIYAIC